MIGQEIRDRGIRHFGSVVVIVLDILQAVLIQQLHIGKFVCFSVRTEQGGIQIAGRLGTDIFDLEHLLVACVFKAHDIVTADRKGVLLF